MRPQRKEAAYALEAGCPSQMRVILVERNRLRTSFCGLPVGALRREVQGATMPGVNVTSVLITGTTSGVGRALLDHYARHGVQVIAVNRRRVAEIESQYPTVRFECVDVRSAEHVEKLVRDLAASDQLPEVFILNAGVNRADNDESFQLSLYREVIDTNLFGVLNFIEPPTRLPPAPVQRHVVAISSLAGYAGNPYGLGYHTSKQALTACFEVWSRMYAGTDLVFQQVRAGSRSYRDLHHGRAAPGLDGPDQEPFLRLTRRHRAGCLAVCVDPQPEADLSVAGLPSLRRPPALSASHPRLLPGAHDARRKAASAFLGLARAWEHQRE